MEYCQGRDLFDYLQDRNFKIPEKKAAKMVYELASAISYLHNYGIVHRDLKPENILMSADTDDACIKLLDFGLSRMLSPSETCKDIIGTLVFLIFNKFKIQTYVAPEILLQQEYNKSVDYWSLGIISYVLLSGCLP